MFCSIAQFKLKTVLGFFFLLKEGKLFFCSWTSWLFPLFHCWSPTEPTLTSEASVCTRKVLVNYDWPYKVIARCFGLLSKFSKAVVWTFEGQMLWECAPSVRGSELRKVLSAQGRVGVWETVAWVQKPSETFSGHSSGSLDLSNFG